MNCYQILHDDSISALEAAVNDAIKNEGWQPCGGVICTAVLGWAQAMTKPLNFQRSV